MHLAAPAMHLSQYLIHLNRKQQNLKDVINPGINMPEIGQFSVILSHLRLTDPEVIKQTGKHKARTYLT